MSSVQIMKFVFVVSMLTVIAGCHDSDPTNQPPQFTSATSVSVPEGQTDTGYVASATDPNAGDTVTYSISGGADATLFRINASTGALSFVTAPEFSSPADADANNVYELVITADDGGDSNNTATLTLQVTVTSVNQAPVFTSAATVSVDEGSVSTGYTATADDADGDALTFSISGGADEALLSIDAGTGVLTFNAAPAFATPQDADADNVYVVELTVEDGRSGVDTLDVSVTVLERVTLSVLMTFPTANANLGGDVTQTTLSGRIIDSDGLPIDLAEIDYLEVNGDRQTLDVDDPGRWTTRIPVSGGINTLDFVLALATGTEVRSTEVLQNTALHGGFADSFFDNTDGSLYVINAGVDAALLRINTVTGERTVVTGNGVGSGTAIEDPRGLVIDTANDRALISDWRQDAVFGVDLVTGDRTVISSPTIGTGDVLDGPNDIALDSENNRVLAASFLNTAVVSIDLATGNRSIVSDATTGTGPSFGNMQGIAYDAANDIALVSDGTVRGIIAVDLVSGDRTILSDSVTGAGPGFRSILDSTVDADNNRLLVADALAGVLAVDLSSGDRTAIFVPTDDYGLNGSRIQSVALDTSSGTAYVPDQMLDLIFAVDTSSGDSSIASDNAVGSGPIEAGTWTIRGLAHDVANRRLLFTNSTYRVIGAIDLASGNRSVISSASVGTGPDLGFLARPAIDPDSNRLIYPDPSLGAGAPGALVAADLETGDRTVLSDNVSVGSGPSFANPSDVFVDTANDRAFVLNSNNTSGLIEVTLSTGDRSVISNDTTGAGPLWTFPDGLDVDLSSNTAYVSDDNDRSVLYSVDLLTGDRAIFSDNAGIGVGPNIDFPNDVALDIDSNRVLILNRGGEDNLMAVDISTGDRSIVSGSGVGSGVGFKAPYYVELDLPNNRAFIYDLAVTGVLAVDLTTGERVLISR